jgi:hypothetical protein
MRKLILIIILLFELMGYGQKCTPCNDEKIKLKANGPDLFESKTQIEYGTPLCIEVSGVNTFLMKTYSTYTPVNFDFSTKGFLDIKMSETKAETIKEVETGNKKDKEGIKVAYNQKISNENKIYNKDFLVRSLQLKMINEGSNDIDQQKIADLENEIAVLKQESEQLDIKIKELTKDNEKLKKKYDSIFNIVTQTLKFKEEFIIFQKHFSNIDKYTTLKNILLAQIKKDSIFIGDVQNFVARSTSSYNAIYGNEKEHLMQKTKIVDELTALETSYLKLVSIYQQLNTSYKNKELKLSGELKDGDNVLKFKNISASFETKYLFEDEMQKVKVINDSLSQPKNRTKIIEESQAGIDLYDEIYKSKFTTTIISNNVYDDVATIKPQLKDSKGKVMYEYREFKVSSYGNWKVNGSAGYFLNFISDDNYTLRKKIETDSNSKTGVNESNTNTLRHSLGGLLHAYYNFKGNIDAGFSVGLSINDNANAGFYLGLSAFVTESNRLVLTSGVSFNKIKKINTTNLKFDAGAYNFINESDAEIKYDEVYKPSFFIGISYNLF